VKLTREQAAALQERIGPMVNYIVRLRERATKVGFAPADEFHQVVRKAEEAIRHLWILLHYASCVGGVGKPARSGRGIGRRVDRPSWEIREHTPKLSRLGRHSNASRNEENQPLQRFLSCSAPF
jgi:hypothetical protein